MNESYQRYPKNIEVMELDFMAESFSVKLEDELRRVDIAVAADGKIFNSSVCVKLLSIYLLKLWSLSVIYDDDITEGLIKTTLKLFKAAPKLSEFYVALEKRYVFVDSVCAPMYEHFLKVFQQSNSGFLKLQELPTQFPQYFEYDRCKELVLMKITRVWWETSD